MKKTNIKVRNINDKATDYCFVHPFTNGADKYLKETYGNATTINHVWIDGKYVVPKDEIDSFPKEPWMTGYMYELTDKFSGMTIKYFLETFFKESHLEKSDLIERRF